MKLIVVRHAIAEERDENRWPDDSQRPLTKEGRKSFVRAARGLGRLVPEVGLVLSSPYTRAWDTALLLEQYAGWPPPQACDELRGSPLEDVVRAIESHLELKTVAIVGHEPHLGHLIGYLLSPSASISVGLKKGAAGAIDLSAAGGRLLWLLQPKALRLIA